MVILQDTLDSRRIFALARIIVEDPQAKEEGHAFPYSQICRQGISADVLLAGCERALHAGDSVFFLHFSYICMPYALINSTCMLCDDSGSVEHSEPADLTVQLTLSTV
jgi:hypothetical protein